MSFQNQSIQLLALQGQVVVVRSHGSMAFISHTRPETYFEEAVQGTTDHYLLCVCEEEHQSFGS